jgi:hypothetical protein
MNRQISSENFPENSSESNFSNTAALVRAALAARSSWLSQCDRSKASVVFAAAQAQPQRAHAIALTAKVIVPEDVLKLLLIRVDNICTNFSEMFDAQADGVKYGDGDIDAACKALPVLLDHELDRIVTLNGSIPSPALSSLHERAKHIAVSQ